MIGYSKTSQLKPELWKKKTTERNIEANHILDQIYGQLGLYDICEVGIAKSCLKKAKITSTGTLLKMSYAHKHKRDWYKDMNRRDLLHSFEHTVRACLHCHNVMEYNEALTLQIFKRLRPRKG